METTNPDTQATTYVGLDVAKDRLDFTLDGRRCAHVPNSPEGFALLITRLRRVPHPRVVCEATGGYERALVTALLREDIEVCVVNPGRVRAFANAEGLLAKTDKLDALLLKRFGERMQPRLHVPMDQAALALRELLDYRAHVTEQRVATQNRLALAGPILRERLQRQLQFLQQELTEINRLIAEHIAREKSLRTKAERLQQLKGVGPILSATLLAHLPELGQLSSRKLAALVGVAPFARDSGNSRRCRHVRGGRLVVRSVLYMAAVAAVRYNPILSTFFQRLVSAGKSKMCALIAVMRKMLHVLNKLIEDPQFTLAG